MLSLDKQISLNRISTIESSIEQSSIESTTRSIEKKVDQMAIDTVKASTPTAAPAKKTLPRYKKTIEKLHSYVTSEGRVLGFINYARALGFTWIKGVIPNPKITCYDINDFKKGYLILGCDGLYEKATTNEIGSAIAHMKNNDSLETMGKKLVYNAIMHGSYDNISVIKPTILPLCDPVYPLELLKVVI